MENQPEMQRDPSPEERAKLAQDEMRAVLAKHRCTLRYYWGEAEPVGDGHRALQSVTVGVVPLP